MLLLIARKDLYVVEVLDRALVGGLDNQLFEEGGREVGGVGARGGAD